jgi:hypothetical protein
MVDEKSLRVWERSGAHAGRESFTVAMDPGTGVGYSAAA